MSIKFRILARGWPLTAAFALLFAGNVLAADLIGVVRRDNGATSADSTVSLSVGSREVRRVSIDPAGRFVIRNIRPGVYRMQCGSGPAVSLRVNEGLNETSCRG